MASTDEDKGYVKAFRLSVWLNQLYEDIQRNKLQYTVCKDDQYPTCIICENDCVEVDYVYIGDQICACKTCLEHNQDEKNNEKYCYKCKNVEVKTNVYCESCKNEVEFEKFMEKHRYVMEYERKRLNERYSTCLESKNETLLSAICSVCHASVMEFIQFENEFVVCTYCERMNSTLLNSNSHSQTQNHPSWCTDCFLVTGIYHNVSECLTCTYCKDKHERQIQIIENESAYVSACVTQEKKEKYVNEEQTSFTFDGFLVCQLCGETMPTFQELSEDGCCPKCATLKCQSCHEFSLSETGECLNCFALHTIPSTYEVKHESLKDEDEYFIEAPFHFGDQNAYQSWQIFTEGGTEQKLMFDSPMIYPQCRLCKRQPAMPEPSDNPIRNVFKLICRDCNQVGDIISSFE